MVLALAMSCSKDVVISKVESTPIAFSNVFIDKSTKAATDISYGNSPAVALEKFNIYGIVTGDADPINIYDGDEVTGTVGGDWSCDDTQYWVDKCSYDFIALVDATASKDITVTSGGTSTSVTARNTVSTDADGMPTAITYDVRTQKDVLIATAERDLDVETPSYAPVQLTFRHLLSKVVFTFTNAFAETSGVELTVKDIQITARQSAVYTIGGASAGWSKPGQNEAKTQVKFGNTETISPGGDYAECGNVALLIPGDYTDLHIAFVVEHNKGGNPTPLTADIDVTLLEGNSYNLTAELNSANVSGVLPIRFVVKEDTGWEATGDKDVDYRE